MLILKYLVACRYKIKSLFWRWLRVPNIVFQSKKIRERLNRPSNFVANYRRRLLDDQVIKSTNYGEVAFTLPFFKEYLLQQYRFEQGLE